MPPTTGERYDPTLESPGADTDPMKMASPVYRWYFQLKVRYAVIGTYLDRIWKAKTDQCYECTLLARMNTNHVLLCCTT